MKRIFTLAASLLLTAAVFAADHRPVLTVNSAKNYKIVVDGRTYFGNNLKLNLLPVMGGRHTIKVFEMRRGFFGRGQILVASSSFRSGRNDVNIKIDRFGNLKIREERDHRRPGRYDRDWDDRDHRDDRDRMNNRF